MDIQLSAEALILLTKNDSATLTGQSDGRSQAAQTTAYNDDRELRSVHG
jgi:hypothetical protein